MLGIEDARPLLRAAWEGGINFFDTANVYAGGHFRGDHGPSSERTGATQRDHSDDQGLQPHAAWAERNGVDSATPVEETMEALHDVVKAGKARYIGASPMFA